MKGFSAFTSISFLKHAPPAPCWWFTERSLSSLSQTFKILQISTLSHTTIPFPYIAVLCCVFMCSLPFALWKQPWNYQRSFSLASSCHVMSADTWCGVGDVCIAQEAVTTLLSIFSCSSPAVCHTVTALGLHSACHSYCWGHNQITGLRLLHQLNIHLKNVVTYTTQRSSEIK